MWQELLSHILFFWKYKLPEQNEWRPLLAQLPTQLSNDRLPAFAHRPDLEALAVDAAPLVVGVGGVAHLRQALDFGLTARASVFRNPKTLAAVHRATLFAVPLILTCQTLELHYRSFIPRWASDRERRRLDDEVRSHVKVGMLAGSVLYMSRISIFRAGRKYWAPIDIVLGGALTDLLHREYLRAHDM